MRKLLLAVLVVPLFVSPGEAANPACGQTISGTWSMTSDMDCTLWLTHGVDLESFATLNCNGFKITGPDLGAPKGTATGRYGFRIDEKTNVTLINCEARGYERGFNIAESTNVLISGGNSKKNTKYGYNVGVGSSGVVLDGVQALLNEEGMHFGGPFLGQNVIRNATVTQNWQEGVYLHRSNLVLLEDTLIADNSQDPNGSHADLNLDETTDMVVTNVSVTGIARTVGQAQASMSMCVSSVANGCQ